jgi:hypothetical protein
VNKSRSVFKHEMEASFLLQEDKELFNELHTSGLECGHTDIHTMRSPHFPCLRPLRQDPKLLTLHLSISKRGKAHLDDRSRADCRSGGCESGGPTS